MARSRMAGLNYLLCLEDILTLPDVYHVETGKAPHVFLILLNMKGTSVFVLECDFTEQLIKVLHIVHA
jgi:hypothetical protein